MIKLIQFPKPLNRPSYSPFCLKLETYFRIAKIEYENKYTISTKGSKKKKMPMILDDNVLIEDSTLIIDYLKNQYGFDLDKNLTSEQKSIAKAFQWLCEKSLVDIVVYFRWADPQNWLRFRDIVFHKAPWFIKLTVANSMAKNIRKTLYKHGTGRFSDLEKIKILKENLSAISNYLQDKIYFFGDEITSIDAIIYSHLIQVQPRNVVVQFEGLLENYPNLVRYVQNISNLYWPEFDSY